MSENPEFSNKGYVAKTLHQTLNKQADVPMVQAQDEELEEGEV